MKLGLKLFSVNTGLAYEAHRLLAEDFFSYIELYVPPGTYNDTVSTWTHIARACGQTSFIIHAPHYGHGVNLADKTLRESNRNLFGDARRFADALYASHIIVHSGFGGPLEEVCLQALGLQETRLALENTPKVGIGGESCVAWSPALVDEALATGAFRGFVLDIGHALYASASASTAWELFLAEFLCMSPDLFHLSDGYMGLDKDIHESIGKGTFDLKRILAMIPPDAAVTLETPRDMDHGLNDSIHDALEVRRLVSLLS